MNNPLHQVGQTPRPESEAPSSADDETGDAGAEARQHNPSDAPEHRLDPHPRADTPAPAPEPATPAGGPKTHIKKLQPGEPPPESSAGS